MILFGRCTSLSMVRFHAFVLVVILCGCVGSKVDYWHPPDESAQCMLVLDNRVPAFHLWKQAFPIQILVDGYNPEAWGAVKKDGALEITLPAGKHTVMHKAEASWPYRFDSQIIKFEAKEGETYGIRLDYSGTMFRKAYSVSYEGWPEEITSQWPTQVVVQGGP